MQEYRGSDVSMSYPSNWKVFASRDSASVTIAPVSGIQESEEAVVGYGAVLNYYKPKQSGASLQQATSELVSVLRSTDPAMQAGREAPGAITVGGKNAMLMTLNTDSIFQGQKEVDQLLTVQHPNGILFIVFVAPQSESQYAKPAFDRMMKSLRFGF